MQSGIAISNALRAAAALAVAVVLALIACDGNERTAENDRAQDARERRRRCEHRPAIKRRN
jgi:hypothetical protein